MLTPCEHQSLAVAEAEKRELRAKKRAAKRKKKRTTKCKTAWRLPLWFKYVTMFLCLAYCSVMALITIVYGIKFTLRGEEVARQLDIEAWGTTNITYFNSESTNMMSFELTESTALDLKFVTRKELATRRNVTNVTDYDVDLYANDTVTIVRPVAEGNDEVYKILGQEGTYADPSTPTDLSDPTGPTDPTDSTEPTGLPDPTDTTDPTDPTVRTDFTNR
jgi:hypothetical protein